MAAEEIYFGEANNNIEDLKEATCIAKYLVENGMSDLGLAKIDRHEPEMTRIIYEEANKILAKCLVDAKAYVTKYRKNLDNVIEYVREHNEIDATTIFNEFENKKEEKVVKAEKKVEKAKVAKETKTVKTEKEVKTTKKSAVKKYKNRSTKHLKTQQKQQLKRNL